MEANTSIFAVIIPAYNEAEKIREVVLSVNKYAVSIVVDDGSSDLTNRIAKDAGAIVVSHNKNCGYDAALQSGFMKAIEEGFEYAITIDGDGQHNAVLIKKFMEELISGFDIVVGMRDKHQRVSETIFSWFGRVLWRVKDPLCGMKGYKLEYIKELGFFDTYQSIGTECLIRAVRSGKKIKNIPIPTSERVGESRFGSGIKANNKIFRALILGLFKAKPLVR